MNSAQRKKGAERSEAVQGGKVSSETINSGSLKPEYPPPATAPLEGRRHRNELFGDLELDGTEETGREERSVGLEKVHRVP